MGKIDEEVKNKANKQMKKMGKHLLLSALPWILIILIIVVLATSLFSIFNSVKERIVAFLSNTYTTITKIWKNLTDDFWIDMGKEIEFESDEETRSE